MSKPIASVLDEGGSMYVSERKIHPHEIAGRFQRLRMAAVFWLLGMYYLFPWLTWGDRQAVLFDLPARKFYVFGLNFWPQDFVLLAGLLILAGLSLFFFTAIGGRLWCGYACPQTVWTEVFLWMERATEGGRNQRIKLDAAPWSQKKLLRKGAKHSLWLIFALWTGFTFVGFFTPIRELGTRLGGLDWSAWEWFWVLFYSLATWGNAGVLREQVCKYMCPYARFQSAMFDRDTLLISYDTARGEPRGRKRRESKSRDSGFEIRDSLRSRDSGFEIRDSLEARADTSAASPTALFESPIPNPESRLQGHCINCTLCLQVCPTGIDIRDGLQYECIACGACIDACDSVMDKVGTPRALIRYSTQNAVDGLPTRVLRPRVVVYGLLLGGIFALWVVAIATRAPLIVDVLRDRNALYRVAADKAVENAYTLKLINKQPKAQRLRLRLEDAGAVAFAPDTPEFIDVAAEEVKVIALTLRAASGSTNAMSKLRIKAESVIDSTVSASADTRFFAPGAVPL